jgi:hypothetical protein
MARSRVIAAATAGVVLAPRKTALGSPAVEDDQGPQAVGGSFGHELAVMAAMHGQVNQRAEQHEPERQKPDQVRAMLGKQEDAEDQRQDDEDRDDTPGGQAPLHVR